MGVHYLWKCIKDHKKDVVTNIDLVARAKTCPEKKLNIMIDFYSFQFYLKDKLIRSLSQVTDLPRLLYAAGEYKIMDKGLQCIISELRNVNIEPVFFFDAARGSGNDFTEQKLPTWTNRYFGNLGNLKKVFLFLNGKIPFNKVQADSLTRPCLQEIQNIYTLQEMKCKVVFHVSGEADVIIGKSIRSNEQAFILSNDTDFAIFPESNFLPIEFFDVNGQIGLGLSSFEPKVPENIVCGMVCADDITKLFKLPNRESLIEVATIAGNDVTRPVLMKYKEYREVYMARLFRISDQIKKNKAIEKCDFFGLLMSKSDEFNQAVRHSRQFYALQVPEEDEPQFGSSLQIIFSNIRQGKFPSTILSMYRGNYWRRQILEDPAEGMPVAEEVMSEIRSYLYKLVLPLEREFVTEIGRTMTNNFTETQVTKISDDQFPSLEELQNKSISSKLNLFEKILSHKDSFDLHEGQSHLKVFGTKTGFTFLILRYFLSLNWNLNLCLTSREVYALIAWTAVEHNAFEYLKLNILPSSRCLTLQSWVQNLYRIVYAFLGNVLGISDEFPPPKELFTASAWVVLYTSCSSEKLVCPKHVAIEEMQKAHQCVVKTIQENEDLVKKIIDGFFSFDLTELKATDWAYHK